MSKLHGPVRRATRQRGLPVQKQTSQVLTTRTHALHDLSAGTVGKVVVLVGVVVAAAQLVKAFNRAPQSATHPQSEYFSVNVVAEYPHDPGAFTQGLYGESTMRQVALETGDVLRSTRLESKHFGEGLVKLGDRLYQLTWLTPTVIIYDTQLKQVGTAQTHLKDGWGLTTDGRSLIVSDGSSQLHWFDPSNMKVQRSVTVRDQGQEVPWLNELEMIEGEVWANVWQTECIARIDPDTGNVRGWMLMHGMRQALQQRNLPGAAGMDVLNGIAYDAKAKRLFVTGKKWPRVFEVTPKKLESDADGLQGKHRSCIPRNHGFM